VASQPAELVDVLLQLPYRQRATLVLRYWAGFTEAEIAEALGCRPGTVKTLVQRGLHRLRKVVEQ
jgi:RNA polymerase sigma factor (sigma-70 family)